MNTTYSQKRLLLAGLSLLLCVTVARSQINNPYFLTGPEVVCSGECIPIYIQGEPDALQAIAGVTFINQGPTNYTQVFSSGNYFLFCPAQFPTTGGEIFQAVIVTHNGLTYTTQSIIVPVNQCADPIAIISNAAQTCPAGNVLAPPPPPPPNGFALLMNSVSDLNPGQQVCIDVTTQNFSEIVAMQFSINYDPTQLQFVSVANLSLSGLTQSSFGLPGPGGTPPGTITLSWTDPSLDGVTRPNGSTIFRLCFIALPGACTTDVVFSGAPTPILIFGTDVLEVPFNSRPGRIQVNSGISSGGNPPIPGCCENVCAGATVLYRITGAAGTAPPNWQVEGAQSFTVTNNGFGLEVVWGSAGAGVVSAFAADQSTEICVNILALPEAGFSSDPPAAGDTLRLCRGQSAAFANTSQGGTSYLWQFGDGSSSTLLNSVYAWEEPGTYRVALIAYNECLCTDTSFLTVIVSPSIAPEVTCRGTVCEGTSVTYTTDADCGTFLWTTSPNGTVTAGGGPTDNFISINWDSGPEGLIQLQVENCTDTSYCAEPNQMRVPVIGESAQINGPEQVCRAQAARYAVTPFGGTEFNWSVSGQGAIESGQGTPEVVVQWAQFLSSQPQWVAVEYYNCYLDCGGRDTIWVNILPEFYITGPVEVCLDDPQSYTARLATPGLVPAPSHWEAVDAGGTVVWTSAAATATPTVPWNFGPGRYRLLARPAAPEDYCNPSAEIPVRVVAPAATPDSIIGADAVCAGLDYTYFASGALPGQTVEWTLTGNAGPALLTGNPINVIWSATPPYSLSVRQLNPQGCASPTLMFSIEPVSPAAIAGDADVCEDAVSTFSAPVLEAVEYTWTIAPPDAGTILNALNTASIEVLWNRPGPATIQLGLCGQNVSFPVTVHPKPQPQVLHPAYLCPGDSAAVQTTLPFNSYVWNNETGVEVSQTAMPLLPFGYYQVSVSDNFGCAADVRFNIEGYPNPDISISTPDNTGLCPGGPPSTMFALNSQEGYTYQWYFNNTALPGATNVTYSTAQLGDYYVEVTDHNGCTALSNVLSLFLYCGPGGGGGFPGGGSPGGVGGTPTTCDPNTLLNFDIQATADCNVSNYVNTSTAFVPGSLAWNFGDPASGAANTSTLENPSHTFSRAGFFRIYLSGQGLNPGPEFCYAIKVDTVPLAANFYFERACTGEALPFFDASTFLPIETIASRHWDFGDPASGADNNSALKDPTHIFSGPGIYTVTLTVTAASGCSAAITKQVEVFPLPTVSFQLPSVNCAATALPFLADVSSTVTEVFWTFGNPGAGAADTSRLFQPFHRYETVGAYTVSLQATSIYGCVNDFSRSITVEPNGLSGTISFNSPICAGDSSLLMVSPGGVRWEWSTGDTTETIYVRQTGTYALTVYDAEGCSYEPATVAVQVIPPPRAPIRAVEYTAEGQPIGYTYDSLSICVGEDVFLEVISSTGQTYLWSTGQPGVQIEFSENRGNRLGVGEYDVSVTVTETTTGCVFVEQFSIFVRPLPAVPLVTANPPGNVCEGTPVTFTVSNPQAGVSYSWSSGTLGTVLETARPGQYSAIATNEWGCTEASAPQTVLPGPEINLIPAGCHNRCRPDTLCFPPVPGIASYQWFFEGVAQGPVSGSVPQVVISESGAYFMRMTTDQGCTLDSDPLTVDLFDGFGDINGQVYWDRNNNGLFDAGDSLMVNVPLILLSGNTPVDTVLSQTGGQYSFVNILAADYGLQLDTAALPFRLLADTVLVDTALVGCDVEVIVNWRLYCINSAASLDLSACAGGTVDFNGTPLAPGTTTDFTFVNAVGCDSILTVTVNTLPASMASLSLSACAGGTVDFNGTPLASGTVTDFTFVNAVGCDSILTVTVNTLPPSTASLALSACPGSTLDFNGTPLAPGTTTDFTFVNAVGCDSILTVTVNTLPPSTASLALSACAGGTVDFNGTPLAPGTTTDFTFVNAVGCDSILTVTVNTLPPSTASISLNACPGSTVDFNGTPLAPGTTTDFTFVNAVGCDSILTVTVSAFTLPTFQATATESCPNRASGSIAVSGSGFSGFALNGNAMQADATFADLPAGAYTLRLEDTNGCVQQTQVQVSASPPLQVLVANTLLPCSAEAITMEAQVFSGDDGNLRFLWDNGQTDPQRSIDAPGDYTLTTINGCDTLTQSVQVRYDGRPDVTPIYIPNAFTPNDDGINDRFRGFASNEVEVQLYELMVFDRWGNVMFHTKDLNAGWDGKFRGREQDPAVFVWWLRATVFHCGRVMELNKKGDVTLVR
ncbi:MAG: gliding motility-associated C-terminal domain-containing protein [Saprospiraceae bacterium]|nr:gliding motility-associated C-terminal domain-containing protein [Saprospiraceae bacterium]